MSFRYPRADEVSLASLEAVARTETRDTGEVLRDITFTAEPGQMVALVGPSGAGKTTITHLVARLYDVGGGTVRVGGLDVRDVTLESLEDVVGYVTQDAHMFHDTIRANLLYARPGADDRDAALEAAQIAGLVRALPDGLDTVVGDRGYRLSGGERQRLAIARLLLKAPAVVVLDEATAHLDSESEFAVQRPRRGPRGPHQPGHRAPALDRPPGRPDPGRRRRPHPPARHPRHPAGGGRPVRRPLPHPVRRRPAPGRRALTQGRRHGPPAEGPCSLVTGGARGSDGHGRCARGRRRPGGALRPQRGVLDAAVADLGDGPSPWWPTTPTRTLGPADRRAREAFGRLDGALISVGGPPTGTVASTPDEAWEQAFGSVFLGAVRIGHGREVCDALQPGGSVALVLSSSVRSPIPGLAISNGLRPGLAMVAKNLRRAGPRGVRVNGLLPGRVGTERVAELDASTGDAEAAKAKSLQQIPLGRYGEPEEFGRAAAFLLSPASSFVTGVMLPVDGGMLRTV